MIGWMVALNLLSLFIIIVVVGGVFFVVVVLLQLHGMACPHSG